MRYKITDKERGHRKKLSENEETVKWTLYLPKSLKTKVLEMGGGAWIRSLINKFLSGV